MNDSASLHQTHPTIVKRLKRADGHLKSIIAMIEAGRPCADVAQQLHAVERAITQAKKTLIKDHLDHCLEDLDAPLGKSGRGALEDFRNITKYL